MKFYINGTRRGMGVEFLKRWGTVDRLEDCDIFINNKHDGWQQIELLYKAYELGIPRVINLGSISQDWTYGHPHIKHPDRYSIEKKALNVVNDSLFYHNYNTTVVNFGRVDTPRVAHITSKPKISVSDAADIIQWVIDCPHRIKDISVSPNRDQ